MTGSHFPAEPALTVEFFDVDEQPTVVRKVTDHPIDDMASVFDSTFQELFPILASNGVHPVGPAISLHHRMPTDTATFEVGMPVNSPLPAAISTDSGFAVEPSSMPAGTIARISHIGSFDGLGDAWGSFMQQVVAAGYEPEFPFWEIYVTEPSPDMDPATLRTDLVTRVKKS